MELGAFSVSLSVTDLEASRAFYETLGFEVFGGDAEHGWLILRNGATTLGLFRGMFDGNLLTFNPRMGQDMQPLPDADDVRDIHRAVVDAGIPVTYQGEDMGGKGPLDDQRGTAGSFSVTDPDGNVILIDQFDLPG